MGLLHIHVVELLLHSYRGSVKDLPHGMTWKLYGSMSVTIIITYAGTPSSAVLLLLRLYLSSVRYNERISQEFFLERFSFQIQML